MGSAVIRSISMFGEILTEIHKRYSLYIDQDQELEMAELGLQRI